MNITELLNTIFKYGMEGLYFLLVTIIVFNMLVDFLQRTGIIKELVVSDIQLYGVLSIMLALNNFLSRKFFGLKII